MSLAFLLIISVGANLFQYNSAVNTDEESLVHAGSSRTTTRKFVTSTEWSSQNRSLTDELWADLETEPGMIVVDSTYSRNKGLFKTLTFPWDTKKDIYMLEAYHNLHCLAYIYRALREFEQGVPQTDPMQHHIHCLDALRENTICAADDELRPAGEGIAMPYIPSKYPQRRCRNWTKLQDWAKENSACFKRYPNNDPKHKTLEEWRHCPEGSEFLPEVERYFGTKPNDMIP